MSTSLSPSPEAKVARFYRRRSDGAIVQAVRWFKNGDHPEDNVRRPYADTGAIPVEPREGEIVRYFRHPNVTGTSVCHECGRLVDDHGWIDSGGKGIMVCPGDYIVDKSAAFSSVYFEQRYEAVDAAIGANAGPMKPRIVTCPTTPAPDGLNQDQKDIWNEFEQAKFLALRKNMDYGSSVFRQPVLHRGLSCMAAIQVRMSDKIERLSNLLGGGKQQVKDEAVEDTMRDLAVYAMLWAIANRRQKVADAGPV